MQIKCNLRGLTADDVRYVCENMRDSDFAEAKNVIKDATHQKAYEHIISNPHKPVYCACFEIETGTPDSIGYTLLPCAFLIIYDVQGQHQITMLATQDFDKIWPAIYRSIKTKVFDHAASKGITSCFANVMTDNLLALNFLRHCGFYATGIKSTGHCGATFEVFRKDAE